MIKCKEYIHTISHATDDSWKKSISMWLHYLICVHCRRYVEHLKILKNSIKDFYKLKNTEDHSLSVKKIEDQVLDDLFKK